MILGGNPAFLNLKVTGFPISKRTRNSSGTIVILNVYLTVNGALLISKRTRNSAGTMVILYGYLTVNGALLISERTRNSSNAVVFLKSFLYRKEHSPDQNHAGKTVGKMTYSIKRFISDL